MCFVGLLRLQRIVVIGLIIVHFRNVSSANITTVIHVLFPRWVLKKPKGSFDSLYELLLKIYFERTCACEWNCFFEVVKVFKFSHMFGEDVIIASRKRTWSKKAK